MNVLKQYIIPAILLVLLSNIYAQSFEYEDYLFEENPDYSDTLQIEKDENQVVLFNKRAVEFAVSEAKMYELNLSHKRIRLLTDQSIEANNKVYIPIGPRSELIKSDARVITPSGKIIELGENAIKEGVDEKSGYKFQYFAFEGIEKGSEIEYFYLIKKQPNFKGVRKSIQSRSPQYNVTFELICPINLLFAFKTYNGLPEELERDTTLESKNKWYLSFARVEKFKKQGNVFEEANEKYLVYKVDKNYYLGAKDIINYGQISQNFYESIFSFKEKSDKKIIAKIAKNIKFSSTSTEDKIRTIENYVKTNFTYVKASLSQLENLSNIYDNKAYNNYGGAHLFSLLLKHFDIKHHAVVSCDRTSTPFDQSFEAYIYLQDFFLYIPELGLYLDPSNPMLRLGYLAPENMNTYGLFIKPVEVGDYTTGVGKIKKIKGLDKSKTTSNIYVNVTIDSDFSAVYKIKSSSTGYYAYSSQSLYDLIKKEEDKEKISRSFIEYIDEEGEISELKVENEGGNNFAQKPYIVSAVLETEKFMEVAGNKKLFKVGELIGPQQELYQEEARVHPVQQTYNRSYYREITFNVPEGYRIVNLNDAEITETYGEGDKKEMFFESKVSLSSDNQVKIIVNEYYNLLDLPKEEFEHYQRVINAAANFNKVVFIIEKG